MAPVDYVYAIYGEQINMEGAVLDKKGPEKSAPCDAAVTALSKDTSNPDLMKSVRLACTAHSDSLPNGMASSKDLLAGIDEGGHSREMENLSTVDKALSKKTWMGNDDPDIKNLDKTLREMSSDDRIKLQKDYADTKSGTLIQGFADKLGTTSEDYQRLKGLLMRDDSPESMAAVNLHMGLFNIDAIKRDQDKENSSTATGYENNLVHGRLSPGLSGGLSLLGSIVDGASLGKHSKELVDTLSKLSPQEVANIQKEHFRIYRRELGEMAEDTRGAYANVVATFKKKGF